MAVNQPRNYKLIRAVNHLIGSKACGLITDPCNFVLLNLQCRLPDDIIRPFRQHCQNVFNDNSHVIPLFSAVF